MSVYLYVHARMCNVETSLRRMITWEIIDDPCAGVIHVVRQWVVWRFNVAFDVI